MKTACSPLLILPSLSASNLAMVFVTSLVGGNSAMFFANSVASRKPSPLTSNSANASVTNSPMVSSLKGSVLASKRDEVRRGGIYNT